MREFMEDRIMHKPTWNYGGTNKSLKQQMTYILYITYILLVSGIF